MGKANEPYFLILSLKYFYLKNVTFPVFCFLVGWHLDDLL